LLHGGFVLFNPPNLGHAGSLVQESCKFVELVWRAYGVDLYPAVVIIPDPSANAEAIRTVLNEPAESHTLHTSGYKPAARLVLHFLRSARLSQFCASEGSAALNSA